MRNFVVLLVGLMLLLSSTRAAAVETPKTGPHAVARSEQAVDVVFTVRIIHNGKKPLRDPEMRMRLPLALPHQDIDALTIEGQPRRELDRWKGPVVVYRQAELSSDGALVGRLPH
jgi:hypothetical protein